MLGGLQVDKWVVDWECRLTREGASPGQDEWMYELQNLEEEGDTFNPRSLAAVFDAARRGARGPAPPPAMASRFGVQ